MESLGKDLRVIASVKLDSVNLKGLVLKNVSLVLM